MTITLDSLNELIQKLAEEAYLQEKRSPSSSSSSFKRYKIKPVVATTKKAHLEEDEDEEERDFLVTTLRTLPKNITAYKILNGRSLHRNDVLLLAKQLIQTGKVPVNNVKRLARMLTMLSFDLVDH